MSNKFLDDLAKELKIDKQIYEPEQAPKKVISTQIRTLDYAMDIGGLPLGKYILLYGLASYGKSALTNNFISEWQKAGGLTFVFDTERSFDTEKAQKTGVDLEKLLILHTESLEETFDTMSKLIDKLNEKLNEKTPALIIWDSLAGTPLLDELYTEEKDKKYHIGVRAKMVNRNIRKFTSEIDNKNITMVWINQLTINPNAGGFGDPYVLPGGIGQHFASSIKIRLVQREILKNEKYPTGYGIRITFKIEKNKLGVPFKKGSFNIRFDWGGILDKNLSTFEVAEQLGIVELVKRSYVYKDKKFEKSKLNMVPEEIINEINKEIDTKMGWKYEYR